jgi:hypothetical protein
MLRSKSKHSASSTRWKTALALTFVVTATHGCGDSDDGYDEPGDLQDYGVLGGLAFTYACRTPYDAACITCSTSKPAPQCDGKEYSSGWWGNDKCKQTVGTERCPFPERVAVGGSFDVSYSGGVSVPSNPTATFDGTTVTVLKPGIIGLYGGGASLASFEDFQSIAGVAVGGVSLFLMPASSVASSLPCPAPTLSCRSESWTVLAPVPTDSAGDALAGSTLYRDAPTWSVESAAGGEALPASVRVARLDGGRGLGLCSPVGTSVRVTASVGEWRAERTVELEAQPDTCPDEAETGTDTGSETEAETSTEIETDTGTDTKEGT